MATQRPMATCPVCERRVRVKRTSPYDFVIDCPQCKGITASISWASAAPPPEFEPDRQPSLGF